MSEWALVYEEYDPAQERLREALCTLGNGYLATRGAEPESVADEFHYPGTYLAGGYNRLSSEVGGQTVENEDLVNLPNWLGIVTRGDVLWLNPSLPQELRCLSMVIRYRGHALDLEFRPDCMKVHARASNASPIKVGVKVDVYELTAGDEREFAL